MPTGPALFYWLETRMAFDLNEKRYVKETGLEARIAAIVEPVANDLGYSLVRVKVTPENGCTLQIMAEDGNGRFTIADCERLSKDLSPVLDVEDPIDREYHLEVSSPGIDRPLVRKRDFQAYIGHEAKIEVSEMVRSVGESQSDQDKGRKRWRAIVLGMDGGDVVIRPVDARADGKDVRFPFRSLVNAKLVLTDKLIQEDLKARKGPSKGED